MLVKGATDDTKPLIKLSKLFSGVYLRAVSQSVQKLNLYHVFSNDTFKITATFPRDQRVNETSDLIGCWVIAQWLCVCVCFVCVWLHMTILFERHFMHFPMAVLKIRAISLAQDLSNSSLDSLMATKWCTKLDIAWKRCLIVFSCDQAALWMVFSVRLSVTPFYYVPIIVSSWNFQE